MKEIFDALIGEMPRLTTLLILEWGGAAFGLIGALLLATHSKHSRFGWLFFLGSYFALMSWAAKSGAMGLLVLQVGFTVTSLIGLKRSGLIGISWLRKTGPPDS